LRFVIELVVKAVFCRHPPEIPLTWINYRTDPMQDRPHTAPSLGDLARTWPQYPLPHHLLCRAMHAVTRIPGGRPKDAFVRWFVGRYGVDMDEAVDPRPSAYRTFNDFFTRALRPGRRPLQGGPDTPVSPVDGRVSQAGRIQAGRIFQAKGHHFDLAALLGGDGARARPFEDGSFATLYLSPGDYHRIHMPLAGRLRESVYVPGRVFAVNPSAVRVVPGLFARNERLVTLFDTPLGPMAMVLVGALFVGSIETVWAGEVQARRAGPLATPEVELSRGAEMGRFNLGSTVIVLFPADRVAWRDDLVAGRRVRVGEALVQS
jgi:phosphatidylserine decarboxylase